MLIVFICRKMQQRKPLLVYKRSDVKFAKSFEMLFKSIRLILIDKFVKNFLIWSFFSGCVKAFNVESDIFRLTFLITWLRYQALSASVYDCGIWTLKKLIKVAQTFNFEVVFSVFWFLKDSWFALFYSLHRFIFKFYFIKNPLSFYNSQ